MTMQCDVHKPERCSNTAAFIATKECGHESAICKDCSTAGVDHIIACSEHKAFWEGRDAYVGIREI